MMRQRRFWLEGSSATPWEANGGGVGPTPVLVNTCVYNVSVLNGAMQRGWEGGGKSRGMGVC